MFIFLSPPRLPFSLAVLFFLCGVSFGQLTSPNDFGSVDSDSSDTSAFIDALLESTVDDSVILGDDLESLLTDDESIVPSAPVRHQNDRALFSVMDKITGRTTQFEVFVDETVEFGRLRITPRVCYSRPATERPKTTTFVEVDEILLEGSDAGHSLRRIFTGWMFAESPGLNAVEHAVNDVWLTGCAGEYISPSASDFPLPPGAPPLDFLPPPPLPVEDEDELGDFAEDTTSEGITDDTTDIEILDSVIFR